MWSALTGGLSAILSGGVTGLLGIVAQRYFDMQAAKLQLQMQASKQDHEIAVIKANAEIQTQEWAARTEMAKVEGEVKSSVADSDAFTASFHTEPSQYLTGKAPSKGAGNFYWIMMTVVEFMRGVTRPALTIYLCALTTLIYFEARDIIDQFNMTIPVNDAFGLVSRIIETILYLTTTCILWWFGTRNKSSVPSPARVQKQT